MEKVNVRIEGVGQGLLQHRFPDEDNAENKTMRKRKVFPVQEECEKSLYRDDKGKVCQPAEHIRGTLINAAKNFIYEGKKSYKEIIKSSVFISPDFIPHVYPKWEVDRRRVRIEKASIMRARPLFKKWALEYEIEYDNEVISFERLKEIMSYAGLRVGIGDYRPVFGRFNVTKFKK